MAKDMTRPLEEYLAEADEEPGYLILNVSPQTLASMAKAGFGEPLPEMAPALEPELPAVPRPRLPLPRRVRA